MRTLRLRAFTPPLLLAGIVAASLGMVMIGEKSAAACGGWFASGETDSVVTDHGMVLTIASQQTTLYDQIEYSGSPESFAWVLPISGTATVGLSAEVVFDMLDGQTITTINPPPLNCPPPPDC